MYILVCPLQGHVCSDTNWLKILSCPEHINAFVHHFVDAFQNIFAITFDVSLSIYATRTKRNFRVFITYESVVSEKLPYFWSCTSNAESSCLVL